MERTFESAGPLLAVPSDATIRPSRTWPAGRTCSIAGCGTRLSIYNRSAACSLHEEVRPFIQRGRRRRAPAA